MPGSDADASYDEIVEAQKGYLSECALLLVGAMSVDGTFPTDLADLKRFVEATAEPEPRLGGLRFEVEAANVLPPAGKGVVWVSPLKDGALRLRVEQGPNASLAVTLHSNGELGEFIELEGLRTIAVGPSDSTVETPPDPSDEGRFGNEHLTAVRSAPQNDLAGVVVTWIALYDSGSIVHYLTPHSTEGYGGPIELRDDVGTPYTPIGIGDVDLSVPPLRSLEFAPAVPTKASRVIVTSNGQSVEIRTDRDESSS